jgi:hypothetical protein
MYDLQFLQHNIFDIPVPFAKEHNLMLAHGKGLVEIQDDTCDSSWVQQTNHSTWNCSEKGGSIRQ